MTLHHFPPETDPALDDVLDAATVAQLDTEAAPWIEGSASGRDEYDGRHTRRTGMLIARCPTARTLAAHPLAVGVARHLLAQATTIQLHLTQIISIGPGESAQKLHRDQMAFDFFPFPADYHVQCNTMWALTDFTAANGATQVIPDSSGVDDAAGPAMPLHQAEMRRGSVLFYEGKVLHGGGANRSTTERRGVNITYAVGWVRQEENQYLACPPEIARTLDDDLLKLMGYQQGAFALGYVGDQQDPLSLLRGTHDKVKVIGDIEQRNDDIRVFVTELETKSATEPATELATDDSG
jgi:ectoine hydroxylase-related dioxygenase (phytanoyl-CoA dioxygenase family)